MANKIKEYRKKFNLTQIELAEKLKVTQGTVSRWETTDIFPSTRKLLLIAKILNCTIEELALRSEK